MTRFAILLATEEYKNFSKTSYCHADANQLRSVLVDECDYADQHVMLRLLSPTDSMTPGTLLDDIERLVAGATNGDTVLFYYSGHGHLHTGKTYLVLPHTERGRYEQTALPIDDIANRLRVPGQVNVRIFDTCHSGLDVRDGEMDARGFTRAILDDRTHGWVTLASCSEDEFSYPDAGSGHGVFTGALCEVLRQMPPGPVYPETLKLSVVQNVLARTERLGIKQTPVMNLSVRGNVAIAQRRQPVSRAAPVGEKPATLDELNARSTTLRAFPRLGGKEHKERLDVYAKAIASALGASTPSLMSTQKSAFVALAPAQSMPDELKRHIVQLVEYIGTKPIHQIHETEEAIYERPAVGLLGEFAPRVKTGRTRTVYSVRQSDDWPASYCAMTVKSDGYLPDFLLLYYLIPFQASALLVHLIATRGAHNVTDREWTNERLEKRRIDLARQPDDTAVKAWIREGVEQFEQVIVAECDRRLKLLENELR